MWRYVTRLLLLCSRGQHSFQGGHVLASWPACVSKACSVPAAPWPSSRPASRLGVRPDHGPRRGATQGSRLQVAGTPPSVSLGPVLARGRLAKSDWIFILFC